MVQGPSSLLGSRGSVALRDRQLEQLEHSKARAGARSVVLAEYLPAESVCRGHLSVTLCCPYPIHKPPHGHVYPSTLLLWTACHVLMEIRSRSQLARSLPSRPSSRPKPRSWSVRSPPHRRNRCRSWCCLGSSTGCASGGTPAPATSTGDWSGEGRHWAAAPRSDTQCGAACQTGCAAKLKSDRRSSRARTALDAPASPRVNIPSGQGREFAWSCHTPCTSPPGGLAQLTPARG
jgi:hypothetical protein